MIFSVFLRRFITSASLILGAPCAVADVMLAPPFADHGVLQRNKPIPVWGTGEIGERILVSLGTEHRDVIAGSDSKWIVWLDARPASATGLTLTAKGSNSTVVVSDLLVGEVWLCSGQSNMTFPLERADGAKAEIASAHYPQLRMLAVAQTAADVPADSVKATWRICTPETAGHFTAVGYFFARELSQLVNVPIGLVECAWGGTPIESWLSPSTLASRPDFKVASHRWEQDQIQRTANKAAYDAKLASWIAEEAKAKATGEKDQQIYLTAHPRPVVPANLRPSSKPSSLYNGMVHPLIPYALRGILWYQGEANTGHPEEYRALFESLIVGWRADFRQGNLPFYWVNLANFKGDGSGLSSAKLREAQTSTLSVPETGQALAIDIGNPNDIHPTNKREVGRRLALVAKVNTYGLPGESAGPQLAETVMYGNGLRVRFRHADGLWARGGEVHSLELAGADQVFHPAQGVIEGDTLIVSTPAVRKPVAVRYAFSNSPDANLYNRAGLPAVPFRTDMW